MEMASVDNVKRTWVNYGILRDWTDPVQGEVKCYNAYYHTCNGPFSTTTPTMEKMHENMHVFMLS